jgi:hypothetical protein
VVRPQDHNLETWIRFPLPLNATKVLVAVCGSSKPEGESLFLAGRSGHYATYRWALRMPLLGQLE